MKNATEEKKARTSMSSTFGSLMNPDADRNTKQSIEQILKQRHKAAFDDDHEEVEDDK